MKRAKKDPVMLVYCSLILLSVPTLVELVHHYPSVDQRMRQARGWMAPAPSVEPLLEQVQQVEPATIGMILHPIYIPDREPRTGLCVVYDVKKGEQVTFRLLLFRHDIACGKCRDILAAALYKMQDNTWTHILLIEPWEVEAGVVDTEPFLAQFVGRRTEERLEVGENIDGLSGATASVKGLVEQLNEAAVWLNAHPVGSVVTVSTEGKKEL